MSCYRNHDFSNPQRMSQRRVAVTWQHADFLLLLLLLLLHVIVQFCTNILSHILYNVMSCTWPHPSVNRAGILADDMVN